MLMSYFASDFQDVDDTPAAQRFVQCLKLQQSLEFYHRYKQKTFDEMHLFAGASVLEVGCGTGEDAIALAKLVGNTGKVTAIDRSQTMLKDAINSAKDLIPLINFVLADARQLPFSDHSFHAARVDRTLQHVPNPAAVVAEMARVVRPRGWVVAMEPDWGTFIVNSNQRTVTRKLLDFWCDSFPSGWVGRHLRQYFEEADLTDVQVFPETLVITEFDLANQVFDLVQTAHATVAAGIVSESEAEDWLSELQQFDRAKEFYSSFTGLIVSGQKKVALRNEEFDKL
jgi:ubiquinone/menaquinone biosynthesis C-methylase UbiE